MLIGLAVAPRLPAEASTPIGGVEAVLFYLVSYSAMTLGAFGVLSLLSTPDRPIETINDLAGLGRSRPGAALLFALFLFSLIGIPMTAGFMGKWMLLFAALAVPHRDGPTLQLYDYLALIAVLNAAIGGYYYLRIAGAMFLREPLQPITKPISWPVLSAVWVCAILTLAFGVYPEALRRAAAAATSTPVPASSLALAAADQP
jgi:NADH-quinone oxidoreductase subunit N